MLNHYSPKPGPEERACAGGPAEDRAVHGRRHARGHLRPRQRDGGRHELGRGRPRGERDGGGLVGRRPQPGRQRRHAGEVLIDLR